MADKMSDEERPSAMRRKAGVGRPPPEIGQITAGTALRAALAQAAQDVAGLVATAGNVEETRTTVAGVTEGLAAHALPALVEGPDSRFGLVVLDPQTVAALIEIQTTGRVVPRPADPRDPTRTDAIMCADFIDQVLELFEGRVAEADLAVAPLLTGFRYAVALPEPRAIAMTLDDIPYRQLSCSLDLGQGAKDGTIDLIVPFDPPSAGAGADHDAAAFTDALGVQIMDSRAELTAALLHHEMPISDVAALEVGSLIPVPLAALEKVMIEDLAGNRVVRGRLGQVNGHRAVRISFDPVWDDDGDDLASGPGMLALPGHQDVGRLDGPLGVGPPGATGPAMTTPDGTASLPGFGGSGVGEDVGALVEPLKAPNTLEETNPVAVPELPDLP